MNIGKAHPLFIVGMPRSGTKLIRDLLNNHPLVSIPIVETHFIPHFVNRYGNPPDFSDPKRWKSFLNAFENSSFSINLRRMGIHVDAQEVLGRLRHKSWSEIFAHILQHFGPREFQSGMIWGDKTPGYLTKIDLITELFPNARILLMVRDPRDYCLSARKAWGKNILRAAHDWNMGTGKAMADGRRLDARYIELLFEDLLGQSESSLRTVCQFVGVSFSESLLQLSATTEYVGDAKGETRILNQNYGKYRTQLSEEEIRSIEEIALPSMREAGYAPDLATAYKPIATWRLKMFTAADRLNAIRFHMREKGLSDGLAYSWSSLRTHDWRSG